MRRIKNVKIGQKIEQRVTDYDQNGKVIGTTVLKWIVTEIFPFFVRARRYTETGRIEPGTFNLGELVQLGYEEKGGNYL